MFIFAHFVLIYIPQKEEEEDEEDDDDEEEEDFVKLSYIIFLRY